MIDVENREVFEKWLKGCNKHVYDIYMDGYSSSDSTENMCVEWAWSAWQASAQRQGFKLAPLEPSEAIIKHMTNTPIEVNFLCDNADIFLSEDEALIAYKAMIDAV